MFTGEVLLSFNVSVVVFYNSIISLDSIYKQGDGERLLQCSY